MPPKPQNDTWKYYYSPGVRLINEVNIPKAMQEFGRSKKGEGLFAGEYEKIYIIP